MAFDEGEWTTLSEWAVKEEDVEMTDAGYADVKVDVDPACFSSQKPRKRRAQGKSHPGFEESRNIASSVKVLRDSERFITDEKLNMSLDDIIRSEREKKKTLNTAVLSPEEKINMSLDEIIKLEKIKVRNARWDQSQRRIWRRKWRRMKSQQWRLGANGPREVVTVIVKRPRNSRRRIDPPKENVFHHLGWPVGFPGSRLRKVCPCPLLDCSELEK